MANSDADRASIIARMAAASFAAQLQAAFNGELQRRGLAPINITLLAAPPPPTAPAPAPAPAPPAQTPSPQLQSFCPSGQAPCPNALPVLYQSAPQTIDPTQPFSMSLGGGVAIAIPAGAWPAGETRPLQVLVLAAGPNSTYGAAVGRMPGAALAGGVAYFMPSGIVFAAPVAITLDLGAGALLAAAAAGGALAVYRFNETGLVWEARQACPPPAPGKACGLTSTFSAYAPITAPAPGGGGGGGGGNACGPGCIAGAVIGSVFGAALLVFLAYWIVFRDAGAKAPAAPPASGITPDQAREEGRAQPQPEARSAPATDLSRRAADSAEPAAAAASLAQPRPAPEPRVAAPDVAEWDV